MGAVAVIQPVNAQKVQQGDVITFRSPENRQRIVTHRVIKVLSQGGRVSFHTQGDANDVPDLEPVTPDLILGRVMFHLPLLGYVVRFARTPVGFLLIVGLPALLVVIGEIQNLLRPEKEPEVAPEEPGERALVAETGLEGQAGDA